MGHASVNCEFGFAISLKQLLWSFETGDAEQTNQEFRQYCGNLEDLRIIDICEDPCRHVDSIDIHNYKPRIYIAMVPVGFQPHLPVLNKRLNSSVFCHILEETAAAEQYSPDDPFWDVLVHVWREAEAEWSNACRAMRSGNVTVEEAEKLFCVIEKNDKWYEKCRGELQKMAEDNMDNWVEGRMEQFQTLVKLNTQREAAGILCQIQEEFDFDADVEDIKSFQDIVSIHTNTQVFWVCTRVSMMLVPTLSSLHLSPHPSSSHPHIPLSLCLPVWVFD